MSLLERIAERQAGNQQTRAAGEQATAELEAKPDAGAQAAGQRADYSTAITQGRDQDMQDEAPTPEEQEQFTQAERAMAEIVYGQEASASLIQSVMAAQDPVEGVGKAAADIVGALEKKFPNLGDEVVFGLGESAVEQIVDLVESQDNSINLSDDQMAEALSIGITTWGDNNPGRIDGDMMTYMNEPAPAQL